jgi:hypothetical protein
MLPKNLYRVFYETSATLCKYVGQETHVKRREKLSSNLRKGNAFQSIGDFKPRRDLSKSRIERHLSWQTKKNPSSFISSFNRLGKFISSHILKFANISETLPSVVLNFITVRANG